MQEPIDPRPWEKDITGGPLRLAIVGVGKFAQNHILPGIQASNHCRTTVLVSPDLKTIEYEDEVRGLTPESFHDGDDSEAYDAVYIATPNHLHERIARSAASMGKPTLCEKPLADTADSARAIRNVFEDAAVPLMIGYRVQFKPVIRSLREAISEGLIGTPVHAHSGVSFRIAAQGGGGWRLDADCGGGALRDIGIYPINTLQFLLDRPLSAASATLHPVDGLGDVDVHVAFTLQDGDGFTGLCSASFASEPSSHLHITGTDGLIVIDEPYHPSAQPDVTIRKGGNQRTVTPNECNEYAAQVDYFAQCVFRNDQSEPDGADGVADLEIIESIEQLSEEQ